MIGRRGFLAQILAGVSGAALLSLRNNAFADTVTYTYDELGRVKTVVYSNGATITYEYDAAGNRTTLSQTPPDSVQATLAASPTEIAQGNASTLSWTSNFATGVSIDQGIGAVSPIAAGSVNVSPATTTTYTLTAIGPFGPATAQATVTVYPTPTCTLIATPATLTLGETTTLSWTSANATSAAIDNGIGAVSPVAGGSIVITPSASGTYTLTVNGPAGGSNTASASVTVNDPIFETTIQITGSGPVNLRSLANAAGYNGAMNANITFEVGNGVAITGPGGVPGGIAIDTGTWPGAPFTINLALAIKTGGSVFGGGGAGGEGGINAMPGGAGGDAIYCRHPITITIDSGAQVRGGGGGGGGAASTEQGWPEPEYLAGGGGGGGAPNGPGGAGDWGASNGSNGTSSGGGAGGTGGAYGGAGGTYGTPGANGQGWLSPPSPGGAGGAAGYCIRKNGHTVPVTNNGSTSGTIG
ncbi:hypothetical protein BBF93_06730 [Hyphomonas sp. CACIAM 19H1]|uniref:RHS repeat domain-containing protein n=1 Tax=Hyphomonas sp. CACIAM 19H1 TaxID=1873716 RepID=UPI000DEDF9FA|nr:RHS repeat domain-containing protein [Hyphomonas sp. CACIAM 19H1]AXE63946.1 hypothetical protein BBF93_06730 [Hyphomonas sp. CACIAM 19H1]